MTTQTTTHELAVQDNEGMMQQKIATSDEAGAVIENAAVAMFRDTHSRLVEGKGIIDGVSMAMEVAYEGVEAIAACGAEEIINNPELVETFFRQADEIPKGKINQLHVHSTLPRLLSVYRQADAHGQQVIKAEAIRDLAAKRVDELAAVDVAAEEKLKIATQQRETEEVQYKGMIGSLQEAQALTVKLIRDYKPTTDELCEYYSQLDEMQQALDDKQSYVDDAQQRLQAAQGKVPIDVARRQLSMYVVEAEGIKVEIDKINAKIDHISPTDQEQREKAQRLYASVIHTIADDIAKSAHDFNRPMSADEALEYIKQFSPGLDGNTPALTYAEAEEHLAIAMRFLLDPKVRANHAFAAMGYMHDIFESRIKQISGANLASLNKLNETHRSISEEATNAKNNVHARYEAAKDDAEVRYQEKVALGEARYNAALVAIGEDDVEISKALALIATTREGAFDSMAKRGAFGLVTNIFAGAERIISQSKQGFNAEKEELLGELGLTEQTLEEISSHVENGTYRTPEAVQEMKGGLLKIAQSLIGSSVIEVGEVYADAQGQAEGQHGRFQGKVEQAVNSGIREVDAYISALNSATKVGTASHALVFEILECDHTTMEDALTRGNSASLALAAATDTRNEEQRAAAAAMIEIQRGSEIARFLLDKTSELSPKPVAPIRAIHSAAAWLGFIEKPVYAEDVLNEELRKLKMGENQLAISQ